MDLFVFLFKHWLFVSSFSLLSDCSPVRLGQVANDLVKVIKSAFQDMHTRG